LKERLEALGTAATYQTAVQYQMYHALGLLALGLLVHPYHRDTAVAVAGWSFLAGVILFSGSLYVLSVTGIKALGAVTPFGGVAMLVGWVAFAAAASHPLVPASGWMSKHPEAQPAAYQFNDRSAEGRP
jgi:uncharacterized membrane protein YgdD (TMEM256/DUF423 family)